MSLELSLTIHDYFYLLFFFEHFDKKLFLKVYTKEQEIFRSVSVKMDKNIMKSDEKSELMISK